MDYDTHDMSIWRISAAEDGLADVLIPPIISIIIGYFKDRRPYYAFFEWVHSDDIIQDDDPATRAYEYNIVVRDSRLTFDITRTEIYMKNVFLYMSQRELWDAIMSTDGHTMICSFIEQSLSCTRGHEVSQKIRAQIRRAFIKWYEGRAE